MFTALLTRRHTRWPQAAAGWLVALAALALGWWLPATAAAAPVTLQSIDVSPLSGEQVLVRLHLSAPLASAPKGFTIQQPARLAIDLPNTVLAINPRYQKFDVGVLRAYAAVAAGNRTRIVFDLSRMAPYSVSTRGSDVLVDIGSTTAVGAAPAAQATASAVVAPVMHSINHIDFRRTEDGGGRIIVDLSDPRVQVDVNQEGGRIVARFHDTTVPDALLKRLDVLDFATPVRFIDTRREGGDTVIVVTPVSTSDFQQVSFQTDNQFSLVLDPLTQQQAEQRQREHPVYTGQKITLNFQKIDIRALLQIIADVAKVNMIVSDSVKGDIAIRLNDVPWDQALAIILESKGLGQRRQGNVIFVAPLQELAARRKVELESQQQVTKLAPLHSELMQINYAKAEDIAKLLKSDNNSILGSRGRVTVDPRTNTLLVLDTLGKLSDLHTLIQRLDVPVRQVEIASRIVITNNDFDRQIGTQFGITAVGSMGHHGLITTSGSTTATNSIINNFVGGGYSLPVTPPGLSGSSSSSGGSSTTGQRFDNTNNQRFNLNMPVTAAAPGSIALGILASNTLVDLELEALQAEGEGEVISNPRVITANGREASIEQGTEIPYQESTSSGATSISFKKAVLGLTVTPQITPDGRIIMDLAVRNDSAGTPIQTGNGLATPINTRHVTTQVLVDDGQTVVLGGIYQDTKSKSVSKVPLLGDIPILGALFRFTEIQNDRSELLVFITPKIISQALTLDANN